MDTGIMLSLVGTVLGSPWMLGYSLPVVVFAGTGPWILQRHGPRALWVLLAALSAVAGVTVSLVGGLHRQAMGTGHIGLGAGTLAALAVASILALSLLVLRAVVRRGARRTAQVFATLIVGVSGLALASPILVLYVSCLASGECI